MSLFPLEETFPNGKGEAEYQELAEEYPDFMSKPRRPQTTFLKATSIQLNTNPGGNAYKFVMNKIRMRVSP